MMRSGICLPILILVLHFIQNHSKFLFFHDLYSKSPYVSNHFFQPLEHVSYRDSILYPPNTDYLLITTNNSILKFNANNMNIIYKHEILKLDSYFSCFKDKYAKQYPCHLFGYWAKILPSNTDPDGHQVYICHSNGSASFYKVRTFEKTEIPRSQCPRYSIISFVSADLHFYVGDLERAPKILRYKPEYPTGFPSKKLESLSTTIQSSWIQQNDYLQFVYVFENNNYVYFLLREVADEDDSNCHDRTVKSRIVRIKKDDVGGSSYTLKGNFITFLKATIICPDKSNNLEDTSVNYIESGYFDKDRQILFATFSSGETATTAICQYFMNDIESAFDGPFVSTLDPRNPEPVAFTKCKENRHDCLTFRASKYQLKFNQVSPNLKKNLVFQNEEIWTQIQVISIERSSRQYDIVFVATSKGHIKKFYRKITDDSLCYSETLSLSLNRNDEPPRITDMKLINSKNFAQPFLIVTVSNGVYKIGIEHCVIHSTADSCVDPFCFWDQTTGKCVSIFQITVYQLRQLPELKLCLKENKISNSKWHQWSSWKSCGRNEDICECRIRNCKFGHCADSSNQEEIEVKNCTFHHQWSSWNPWSECSSKCGKGNSTRRRFCFQNDNCPGKSLEIKPCLVDSECKSTASEPIAKWSNWSGCFPKCGQGMMTRSKLCKTKGSLSEMEFEFCSRIELKQCMVNECNSVIEVSPIGSLVEDSGQMNYFATCQGTKSEDDDTFEVSVEYDVKNYTTISEEIWSCWSNWTECQNHCSDSSEEISKITRKRMCKIENDYLKKDLCRGLLLEEENCNEDLCIKASKFPEEKGFQIIYVILVGVVSFTISCLMVVAIVCIYFSKNKTISKQFQQPPLQRNSFIRESYSPSQQSPPHSPIDYGWTPMENYPTNSRSFKNQYPKPIKMSTPTIST